MTTIRAVRKLVVQHESPLRWSPLAESVCGKPDEARKHDKTDEHRSLKNRCKKFMRKIIENKNYKLNH